MASRIPVFRVLLDKCSEAAPQRGGLALMIVRRRPTLPHHLQCSTIGAERLNFRVRNVTGCFPFAMVAETLLRYQQNLDTLTTNSPSEGAAVGRFVVPESYLGNLTVDAVYILVRNKPSAY